MIAQKSDALFIGRIKRLNTGEPTDFAISEDVVLQRTSEGGLLVIFTHELKEGLVYLHYKAKMTENRGGRKLYYLL